jgi:hypothetical protein
MIHGHISTLSEIYLNLMLQTDISVFQYASTIVTYMIVLVQFDQSDHSYNDKRRKDETHKIA